MDARTIRFGAPTMVVLLLFVGATCLPLRQSKISAPLACIETISEESTTFEVGRRPPSSRFLRYSTQMDSENFKKVSEDESLNEHVRNVVRKDLSALVFLKFKEVKPKSSTGSCLKKNRNARSDSSFDESLVLDALGIPFVPVSSVIGDELIDDESEIDVRTNFRCTKEVSEEILSSRNGLVLNRNTTNTPFAIGPLENQSNPGDLLQKLNCALDTNISNPGRRKKPVAAQVKIVSATKERSVNIRRAVSLLRKAGEWKSIFRNTEVGVRPVGIIRKGLQEYLVIFRFNELRMEF